MTASVVPLRVFAAGCAASVLFLALTVSAYRNKGEGMVLLSATVVIIIFTALVGGGIAVEAF